MDARITYINTCFGKTYKKCENKDADWKLFVAKVDNLKDAIEEFERLNARNPLILVGFDMIFNQKFKELESLENSLKVRGMI